MCVCVGELVDELVVELVDVEDRKTQTEMKSREMDDIYEFPMPYFRQFININSFRQYKLHIL